MTSLDHSEALELMRPQVVMAISSNAFSSFRRSAEGNHRAESPATPVAYVIRYQFGPPAQSSADGAPALTKSGCRKQAAGAPPAAPETAHSTNTLTAQFQATVYAVEPATNRLPALDFKALERARTPELFLSALNEAGKPKVLYRIDQPVNVFSDRSPDHDQQADCDRNQKGAGRGAGQLLHLPTHGSQHSVIGPATAEEAIHQAPDVTVSFNLSDESPGSTDLGLGQMVGGFPVISQEHNEPLELGRPRVILAMGSSAAAEQAKPFVHVIRYEFGPPGSK